MIFTMRTCDVRSVAGVAKFCARHQLLLIHGGHLMEMIYFVMFLLQTKDVSVWECSL